MDAGPSLLLPGESILPGPGRGTCGRGGEAAGVRPQCPECLKASNRCYCHLVVPVQAGPKVVLLVHPREDRKRGALNTARMVRRCVEGAELLVGRDFHAHPRLAGLLADPGMRPFLLHPGPGALSPGDPEILRLLGGRRMLLVVPDGTWRQARQILRFNPALAALPRLGLNPPEPGLVSYRRQPAAECLSTLEAVHQTLLALQSFCPSGPPRALEAMREVLQHVVAEQVALGGDAGSALGDSNR